MDRDDFTNNRRARHFGRSNQNFQSNSAQSQQHRRNLRESYMNAGQDFHFIPSLFGSPGMFSPVSYPTRTIVSPIFENSASDLTCHLSSLSLDENYRRLASPSFNEQQKMMRNNRISNLPEWALDENGEIRTDLTLKRVVDDGLVLLFALDKSGCHFLQSNYYGERTQNVDPRIRERVSQEVLGHRDIFLNICKNIFGNFFLQRVIEYSNPVEQAIIKRYIVSDITTLCLDKSACRVVQTALEKLEPIYADAIVGALPRRNRLMSICTDQNANHVIQKVIKKFSLNKWDFLISYLCKHEHENLLNVCQDKYGCRVVQTIIEELSKDVTGNKAEIDDRNRCLRRLMNKILGKCQKLASNEFANYVIQHVIETPGVLSDYRNAIIETCLLRNLLSMSQEKYASHVVERAFCFAPLPHVTEMMEEIFDGYVPHPETGKDALDILIFHQFGNYVVQRILQICCTAVLGKTDTVVNGVDIRPQFEGWLNKLFLKARKERCRLSRFSSGKKILEILETMQTKFGINSLIYDCGSPFAPSANDILSNLCPSSSLFTPSNTTTSIDWASRKNSLSSEHNNDLGCNHPFPPNI